MMILRLFTAAALAGLLASCDRHVEQSAVAPPAQNAAAPVIARTYTAEEWRHAISSTYETSESNSDGEGKTDFVACFDGMKPKCKLISFGSRDAFRHRTFFRPVKSRLNKYGSPNYVHTYISMGDCKAPDLLMEAYYFSKNGWVFLEQASFLIDGEVTLEQKFESSGVKRDSEINGVEERATWIASTEQIAAMRKVTAATSMTVRLSGSKGYVTVGKTQTADIKQDFADALRIFDALTAASDSAQPAPCK